MISITTIDPFITENMECSTIKACALLTVYQYALFRFQFFESLANNPRKKCTRASTTIAKVSHRSPNAYCKSSLMG